MHRMVERPNPQIDVQDAAQTRGERRQSRREIRRVREDQHIRLQACVMGAKKVREMARTNLLLALDDNLQVHRRRRAILEPGSERTGEYHDARLVIDDPTSIEPSRLAFTLDPGRFESRTTPGCVAPRRLHVMMRVEQQRRRIDPRAEPFPDDIGMRLALCENLHRFETRIRKQRCNCIGRMSQLICAKAARRNARDPGQLDQLVDARLESGFEPFENFAGRRLRVRIRHSLNILVQPIRS